jgi:hypothetical protein
MTPQEVKPAPLKRQSPTRIEEDARRGGGGCSADSPGPMPQARRIAHGGRGGEEYSEGRRVSSKAGRVSTVVTDRPFVPNWADAERAGLNRVRRDNAMRWLVDKGMLERDEEAENRLGTEEGFPDYDFGSAFTITDSGRERLEGSGRKRGSNKHSLIASVSSWVGVSPGPMLQGRRRA